MFSSSASPFGTSTAGQGLFGVAQQQPAATTNLFGTQQQQPASTGGGLFGSTTQTNSAGSTLGTGMQHRRCTVARAAVAVAALGFAELTSCKTSAAGD
ncbi:hypothetical protein Emag_001949 [Eimeria magna]